MNSQLVPYLLVGFCVLSLAAGQILFKLVSLQLASLSDLFHNRSAIGLLMVAIVLYAISTLAWIVALRTLPLSKAYLFLACGFILVPLGAHFIIDEPLSPRLVTGSILVALGVWVAVSN